MMTNREKELALYVHIPFCVQKCLYCDFLSAPADEAVKEKYVQVLCREISYYQERLQGEYIISSVFIGGGTPTTLPPALLGRIGTAIQDMLRQLGGHADTGWKTGREDNIENGRSICQSERRGYCTTEVEYTIEANPGTLTEEHAAVLKQMGVNRISLGLQSAQEAELRMLGRIHGYEEFLESFALLRAHGFQNINVDLMADIPGQSFQTYADTLQKVSALQPEHISSYSLIIEEGTPFYEMQQAGTLLIPSEETDRQMYEYTEAFLQEQGYARYEISNYARAGFACRHNQVYWKMGEYLGLGLGASSYLGGKRFTGEDDLMAYLSQKPDAHIQNSHILSKREEMEEYVFLGLRMMEGISLSAYQKRFAICFQELYQNILPSLFQNGLLAESENHDRIYLTKRGIDISNRVLAEFLLEEESGR